jgi:hypothetical protein
MSVRGDSVKEDIDVFRSKIMAMLLIAPKRGIRILFWKKPKKIYKVEAVMWPLRHQKIETVWAYPFPI